MKRFFVAIGVALAALALAAPAAGATRVVVDITCTEATFSYTSFPEGQESSSVETVTVNGTQVHNGTFVFTSPSATHVVPEHHRERDGRGHLRVDDPFRTGQGSALRLTSIAAARPEATRPPAEIRPPAGITTTGGTGTGGTTGTGVSFQARPVARVKRAAGSRSRGCRSGSRSSSPGRSSRAACSCCVASATTSRSKHRSI